MELPTQQLDPYETAFNDLHQQFFLGNDELHKFMKAFHDEINAGLVEERESDLNMIPSFVTGYPTGNEKGTYFALEVAGMDIYVCQVKLKGENGKLSINQFQYKIPSNLASGDDFTDLIDFVVGCIFDCLERVGTQDSVIYPMAVSFGFAIKQTGLSSGCILSLGHGFSYPNGVGVDIVELMHERARERCLPIKIVAIANDTVCTLLAHAYQHPSTRLGIVHNMGTNCSYYERTQNVIKLKGQSTANDMIINTEWCNFGSSDLKRHSLPCTWFDRKVDRESINPRFHVFEKMTTGVFLGELVRNIIMHYIDRELLFEGKTSEVLNTPYSFDTSYMYVCEEDNTDTLEKTQAVLEDLLGLSQTSLADREFVKRTCELVGTRAAKLVGAAVAAIIVHMKNNGIGIDSSGCTISISGSVYVDYPYFHPRVCGTLKDLIPSDISPMLSVGIIEHSRIVGAAIVAMMAEKISNSSDTSHL